MHELGRAFVAGLVVAAAWSLLVSAGDADPLALATRAVGLGVVAVILFYVLSRVRGAGYLVISVTAIVAVVVCHLFVVPVLHGAATSMQFGYPEPFLDSIESLLDPDYWSQRLEYYDLVPSPDLLVIALIVTTLVLTGGSRADTTLADGAPSETDTAFAGTARLHDWSEINRLVLAHAYTAGSRFRRSVIDRAREAFNAPALEAGLDMARLLRVCLTLERRETLYRIGFVLLAIALVLGLAIASESGDPTVLIGALILAGLVNGLRRAGLHSAAYRQFGPGRFDPDQQAATAPAGFTDREMPGLPPGGQNVAVYGGFTPFDFAGIPLGGWTVAIDVSRPASNLTASGEITPFTEGELRSLIDHELSGSEVEGLSVDELVVAQGADATALPGAPEVKGIRPPRVVLDAAEVDALTAEMPDTLRRYFWISVRAWGGDLTISAFWRCALRNRMLHVELSWFALLPIAKANRALDKARDHWTYHLGQFLLGAVLSPIALVDGPLTLLLRVPEAFARALGSERRARSKAIKLEPRYNFGAPRSLRTQLMGDEFLHYFQKMDLQYYQKSVDRILLETLVDFLDDHGIDTADLKESQAAIYNSGVIVQGGDVTAQSLAVGEGARAKTSGVERPGRAGAAPKTGASKT